MTAVADLKRTHRAIWAAGDYPAVAEVIDEVPPRDLLSRVDITPGQDVLDVATGTGSVAVRAAERGATVTGLDLVADLVERAEERAQAAGVEATWVVGDAEDLPFEDRSFDRVMSAIGIQFAPRHDVVAAELVRVMRPDGRLVLGNWTREGVIGAMFKLMGEYAPPPPPFASPPPLWGDEAHVRGLLEPHGLELEFARHELIVEFPTLPAYMDFFEDSYGPTIMLRKAIGEEQWADYRSRLAELLEGFVATPGRGDVRQEFFVITGRAAG